MLSTENISLIESQGQRLVAAARRDPGRMVPQYPDWTLGDLASHTASVLGRTVLICRELPKERISAPRLPEGRDPIDWFEETLTELIGALSDADASSPCWAFGPNQVLGFWETRMLIETEVHRWDAEQAFGDPEPLHPHVAEAGLDEFVDLWFPQLGDVQALTVGATDVGRSWTYGEGVPESNIAGEVSEIYLRLISRPSTIEIPQDWATAVDGLAPPPKR